MVEIIKTFLGLKKTTGNWYFDNLNEEVVSDLKCKIRGVKGVIDPELPLEQSRLVVFDLETSGLHPFAGDEIIALGGVVIEQGKVDLNQTYNHLINPYRPISAETTQLTGITNDMLVDKEGIFEVLNGFLDFLGDGILVAHNADFDLNFINIKLRRHCQTKIVNPIIDTMILSQVLHPTQQSHSLDTLAKQHEIPALGRHSALGDALMTAQLLVKFLPQLKQRGIISLKDLNNSLHWRAYR